MTISKLIYILIFIFLFRLFALKIMNIDLYVDETYYWYWSKHLDFGYYSKPPLIAWIIYFFTSLFGDNLFAIKIASSIFYSLAAIFIYLSAKEFFDKKIAFFSAITYITLPGVSYLSQVISTDSLLSFFWIGSFYFFIKSIKENLLKYWILLGIFIGFGLLSKPTMILFPFSIGVYILFKKELLKNRYLYISLIIAFFIYLPNLIWNYYHNFIMFNHVKEISHIEKSNHFNIHKLLEFLGGQFLIFGIIFFGVYLYKIKYFFKFKLLFIFSFTFLFIISFQALLSKANINWALPTYLTASILITYYLLKAKPKLYFIGLILNIALSLIIYFYHPITSFLGIELSKKNDFYKRVLGWSNIAKKIEKIIKNYPNTTLLFTDRGTMSQMIFYINPHPFNAQFFNPSKKIVNQFAISTNPNNYKHKDFILITKFNNINYIKKYFKSCIFLQKVQTKVYKDFKREYYIYLCKNFKGY